MGWCADSRETKGLQDEAGLVFSWREGSGLVVEKHVEFSYGKKNRSFECIVRAQRMNLANFTLLWYSIYKITALL